MVGVAVCSGMCTGSRCSTVSGCRSMSSLCYIIAAGCMVVLEMIISDIVMWQGIPVSSRSHGVQGKVMAAVNVAM